MDWLHNASPAGIISNDCAEVRPAWVETRLVHRPCAQCLAWGTDPGL